MTDQTEFELSRRRVLGALGTIGVASAGAGLGTSAYFSDQETFVNNKLVAGSLDLKVDWEEHYSDWSDDEMEDPNDGTLDIQMSDPGQGYTAFPPGAPMDQQSLWVADGDVSQFMDNTAVEAYPDTGVNGTADDGVQDDIPSDTTACEYLADVGNDDDGLDPTGARSNNSDTAEHDAQGNVVATKPLVSLWDVKPGDFGEVTFSLHLCTNPGYIWLNADNVSEAENGVTEPEADDPDEADTATAGFGAGLTGLLGSLAMGRVGSEDEESTDSGLLTKKRLLRGTAGVGVGAAGVGAFTGSAAAAVGDVLGNGTLPSKSNGVGIAFDGTYLYAPAGFGSSTLQIYLPAAGGNGAATLQAQKTVRDTSNNPVLLDSLDWDQGRGKMWGTDGSSVYLIDIGDPTNGAQDATATLQFSGTPGSLIDGFAYDGSDDSVWYSPDVDTNLYHFDTDGTQLGVVNPKDSNGNVVGISGVAVGADLNGRPTLYVGKHGPDEIIRIYGDTGEYVSSFATNISYRVEDLACDPVTYPKEAILSIDAYTGSYTAFEVESGTCLVGGVEPEPEPEPGTGELADAIQTAWWYDPDCDNLAQSNEQVFFQGSLADALDMLTSGNGVPLDGDPSTQSRDCFEGEETYCIGFSWWLPVDHGNEVQTDSVTFDLGFYTEQCRHNDGSGMNNEGVDPEEVDA